MDKLQLISLQKDEFIKKLVSFVLTDTILYLPEDEKACFYLQQVNELLNTTFVMAKGFDVPNENLYQIEIENYLKRIPIEKFSVIYEMALELRSVLLAILTVEKKINVQEAFACAFAEELKEQKKWGIMPETEKRHKEIIAKLTDLEKMINERSLS